MRKALLITLTLYLTTATASQAQIASLVLDSFTNLTLLEVIEKLRKSSMQAIDYGQLNGNALVANAGNQMWVATQNLDAIIQGRTNEIFNKMDMQVTRIVSTIIEINNNLSNLVGKVINTIENTVIDFYTLFDDFKLNKRYFLITSINKTLLFPIQKAKFYEVDIKGLGVGTPTSNKVEISHEVHVNDIPLDEKAILHLDPKKMRISIPAALLQKYFLDDSINRVKITVKPTIQKKGIFRKTLERIPNSFYLFLYPKKPGTISIQEYAETFEYGEEKLQQIVPKYYDHGHGENYNYEFRCPDNCYISKVEYHCMGKEIQTGSWKYGPLQEWINRKAELRSMFERGHVVINNFSTTTINSSFAPTPSQVFSNFLNAPEGHGVAYDAFISIRVANINTTCGWSFSVNKPGYEVDVQYNSDRTLATVWRRYDNKDHPLTFRHEFYIRCKNVKKVEPLPVVNMAVVYDNPQEYIRAFNSANYKIEIKWFDGRTHTLYSSNNPDTNPLIAVKQVIDGANSKLVISTIQPNM